MKFFQLSFFFTRIQKKSHHLSTPVSSTARSESQQDLILQKTWRHLVNEFFPDNHDLHNYRVVWSRRIQTRCLASCNPEKKVVRVASTMKRDECRQYLEPLLYHELCHAVVGIKIVNGRRKIHTKEFKNLERRHPGIPLLDQWINEGGWSSAVRKDLRTMRTVIRC
jgi:hypothetical protein